MDNHRQPGDTVTMSTNRASRWILTSVAVATATLILVAIVLAIRPPQTLDPATPEGTAQAYYQAINDGDQEAALAYLVEGCEGYQSYYWRDEVSISVVILATDVDGNEASVDVRITEYYGSGPFGGGSYRHDETLEMERNDGGWLIRGLPWPWDPYMCDEGG